MPTLAEIREQYPQYKDMPDDELARGLHAKFYSDMPRAEFDKKIGYSGKPTLSDIGTMAWNDIKRVGSNIAGAVHSAVTLPRDVITGQAQLPSSEGIPGSVPYGDPNSAGERVADLALLGTPLSPAARIGEKAIAGVSRNVKAEKPVPTATQLTDAADVNYGRVRSSGVEFNPDFVGRGALSIQQELEQKGWIDAPKVASATHDILRRLQAPPAAEPGMATSVTIGNLDAARRSLRSIAQNKAPENASDAAAASLAIDRLDALPKAAGPKDIMAGGIALPYAVEQLEKGRGNVAAAKRSNAITGELDTAHTGILERADDRAAAANSGQNVGNSLRQRIASLLANKKQLGGWNPEEIAQAELVNKGTGPMNASRWVGNFMGGGGGLGAQVTSASAAGLGALAGGVPGAAAGATLGPVIGASAKVLEGKLTRRQVERLDELLRKRSPLYQDTPTNYTPINPEGRAAIARALLMSEGAR